MWSRLFRKEASGYELDRLKEKDGLPLMRDDCEVISPAQVRGRSLDDMITRLL